MSAPSWMRAAIAGLGVALAACGGSGRDPARVVTQPDAGVDAGRPDLPAACSAPDGPVHPADTTDQILPLLVGSWVLCSGDGRFWRDADVAGLQMTETSWIILVRDADGNLTPKHGFYREGTITVTGTSQVNFWDSFGFGIPRIVFRDDPRKLEMTFGSETPDVFVPLP